MQEELDALEPRIAELALISSMYPDQLKCLDPLIQSAIENENYHLSFNQSITALFIVDQFLEVHLVLPVDYVENKSELQVYCRIIDSSLDHKNLQKQLNEKLKSNFSSENLSLINIIPKIIEIWNHIDKNPFTSSNNLARDQKKDEDNKNINEKENSRYWIYSHHIYSSKKRKSIVELCKKLKLNGFMLIGKPGFICIEGKHTDCEEFWITIRSLNWQRITLIEIERSNDQDPLIFDLFEEYLDSSSVFRLLESKKCDRIIKNFLKI